MLDNIFIFGAKYMYAVVIIIATIWLLRQSAERKKEVLIFICFYLPLIYVFSKLAEHFYYNPRPFVAGHFKPLINHAADNGFPSHHTLLASAVSAIIFLFNRRLSLVLWILTLFTGISRVYTGVHHLIDIIGSILIAITGVIIVMRARRFFKK